jgi:NADH:ubiquinone oxidoreductase subunit 5 (subunit L)/multisubunit Na+/H+ antiporter MnhA subunit
MGYLPLLSFIIGTSVAYLVYVKKKTINDKLVNVLAKEQFAWLYKGSVNKWYIDEAYEFVIGLFMKFFRATWKFFERVVIEGIFINGFAWRGSELVGEILKLTQNGRVQSYIAIMFVGLLFFVVMFLV